ncbi:MAG TPA: hypothetical protein VLI06_03865 [Solimonas sp.]|nr:hypothetical protein [Solimonas sp.]
MLKFLLRSLPGPAGLVIGLMSAGAAQAAPTQNQIVAEHNALLTQCKAVVPRAEPLRAQLVRQAMFRLELSMSYRRAPSAMSANELQSAARYEHVAYELLWDACRPLLLQRS